MSATSVSSSSRCGCDCLAGVLRTHRASQHRLDRLVAHVTTSEASRKPTAAQGAPSRAGGAASLGPESCSAEGAAGICIVTGGSSGIGAAVCANFVAQGCHVLSIARRACAEVAGVESVLVDLAGGAQALEAVVQAVRARTDGRKRRLCLVNNASNYPSDSVGAVDAAGLDRALQLNVTLPALLTSALLPFMAEGSSVIFVGSTLSEKAVAGKLSYCTAKHAMVGLMRSVAQDLLWSGIHTVLVCPGITDTPMVRNAVAGNEVAFEAFVKDLQGRSLTSAEVAEVICNAAKSPVLHGSIIHCNNGQKER
eukprot:TRINITY_DN46722_c0_g1_i1.p1 TRINITY_DN46722_c0_g1~~TRINITY_DN46722_c0_g1_i1.p1  ORF type:complete len:309 (+),score=62.71 TRINITY_DN46722_c0_g1_i1:64-990(+)